MINHLIIIKLNGVHKAEQKTLKKYLEYNCWDWKEVNEEPLILTKEKEKKLNDVQSNK